MSVLSHVPRRRSVDGHYRQESYTPRGRGAILEACEKRVIELDSTVAEIFYTTLNDGLIREWCVSHYDHEELVVDTRARLFEAGLAPEEVYRYTAELARGQRTGLPQAFSRT
ncbi:MAG: hypothetical protein MZV70_12580 [Desulfobacterales bacterium]|nr:hypothetical protein [Desulfobacterales bacterium]